MGGRGTESDTPHLPLVLVQGLQVSVASNVMELHLARLARHHQQPTWDMGHIRGMVSGQQPHLWGQHTRS